jgi:hypothetical protein
MPIESATYINTLVPSNPVHTDPLGQADSHIRLIKTVLQSTFPNVAGPVSASDVQLSQGVVPSGGIIAWHGSAASIPAGWYLCNGTNGTPNLVGMFITGADDSTVTHGTSGGASSVTATTATAGSHNHGGLDGLAGGQGLTATTDTQGSHNHGGSDAAYALQIGDLPPHTHTMQGSILNGSTAVPIVSYGTPSGSGGGYTVNNPPTTSTGSGNAHAHGISTDGAHAHNVTVSPVNAHQHSISTDGSHNHTVTVATLPPYYALCWIMKS